MIDRLEAKEFRLEVNAGAAEAKHLSIGKKGRIEINAGKADLTVAGSEDDFNYSVDAGLGNVIINGSSFVGAAGDREVNNKADKDLVLECNMGNLEISFE